MVLLSFTIPVSIGFNPKRYRRFAPDEGGEESVSLMEFSL